MLCFIFNIIHKRKKKLRPSFKLGPESWNRVWNLIPKAGTEFETRFRLYGLNSGQILPLSFIYFFYLLKKKLLKEHLHLHPICNSTYFDVIITISTSQMKIIDDLHTY
jgi:hypothetical protein